jgi:DNA-directed RNA polymerase specialized sigma24 family protein
MQLAFAMSFRCDNAVSAAPDEVTSISATGSGSAVAGFFTTTHWSVVLEAQSESPGAHEALENLCRTYWQPIYGFIRRQGTKPEEAKDLTQGFFALILERKDFQSVRQEKGRLRSFLLASLKHFIANERRDAATIKRGGGRTLIPLDGIESYDSAEFDRTLSADLLYDRRWAFTVLDRVFARLRAESQASPKAPLLERLNVKALRASVEVNWKADTRPLHQLIDEIRATNPAAIPQIARGWLFCALAERDVAAAKEALLASDENPLGINAVNFTRPFVEGVIARMTNDEQKARLAFNAARAEQEKTVQAQPDYGPAWCVLGVIDAALGRKEDALREGRRAVELLPVEKDSINGVLMIQYLAMIAAWVGEKDLACEQLATAVRRPSGLDLSYGQLKLLPDWDALRGEPCFERIVASLAPK